MATLSIVTVVYNAKTELEETLHHLKQQTFKDFELIIIDGGSTDGTCEVIQSYQELVTFFVSEADNGIYDAMNKGMSHATGDWITFLNAGDYYVASDRLEFVFNAIKPNHNFIYADMFLLTESGKKVRYLKAETLTRSSIAKGMIACHQAMFVKRQHCPPYAEHLRYQGDLNWVMDILHAINPSSILYLNKDVVYFKGGGFSDHTIFQQLKEHLFLILSRYSYITLIRLFPRLCRRYMGKWIRKWLNISTFRFWSVSQ